ncbi:hypothetical protein K8S19_10260 [bacterium]|nr:hypothetical protein [bacterium]
MRKFFFLLTACFIAGPASSAVDYQNSQCACVGSKTPAHRDAREIRQAYPADDHILRFIFKTQTYYILVRRHRVFRVFSGWETGEGDTHVWAVLDKQGQLVEWLVFPGGERTDMQAHRYSAILKDGPLGNVYPEVLELLRRNLAGHWPAFIKRVRMNIYRVDTLGQATP